MHDNLYSLPNQKIGNMLLVHHPCNVFEKKKKLVSLCIRLAVCMMWVCAPHLSVCVCVLA